MPNFFNGNGAGGGFPTSVAPIPAYEFGRQKAKIVAALAVSVRTSSVCSKWRMTVTAPRRRFHRTDQRADGDQRLRHWAYGAQSFRLGTIPAAPTKSAQRWIYRTTAVTPGGPDVANDAAFNQRARAPVANIQCQWRASAGQKLSASSTTSSKGGTGTGADADQGDGQGNWNAMRRARRQRC